MDESSLTIFKDACNSDSNYTVLIVRAQVLTQAESDKYTMSKVVANLRFSQMLILNKN